MFTMIGPKPKYACSINVMLNSENEHLHFNDLETEF